MVGGLVNDAEDVWVKGPPKMSADFIHLIKNESSKTVYSALIRTINKRRYRCVSRVKKPRTPIFRDKDYWRSPWGNLLREPSVKIPGSYDFAVDFEFRTSFSILWWRNVNSTRSLIQWRMQLVLAALKRYL